MFLVDNNYLKSKYRYQLVVKLNANRYYNKLLYYLSFYLSF